MKVEQTESLNGEPIRAQAVHTTKQTIQYKKVTDGVQELPVRAALKRVRTRIEQIDSKTIARALKSLGKEQKFKPDTWNNPRRLRQVA